MEGCIKLVLGFILYAFIAAAVRWILETVFGMGDDAFVWSMFWPIFLIGGSLIYHVIRVIVNLIKSIIRQNQSQQ